MKKLRKTFALIMALVMLAGVFTFAAPAALADDPDTAPVEYADHDAINEDYETAIQVFSKMKVIEGIGGNNFDPSGNLTRAAGAAMLSRALLSREGVDQFGAFGSRFRDLPAGEEHQWMVGPIAYMDSRHIMAGVGDNMFAPTDNLTKIQWVRMMLSTLGYGVNDEFVGPGWDSNVLRFAMQQDIDIFGIFNGARPGGGHPSDWTPQNRLAVGRDDLTAPIAREEAIALLYNIVVLIEKVNWDGLNYVYGINANPTAGGDRNLIMGDIGLEPSLYDFRDYYGRPLEWSTNWTYLNDPLVNTPADTPVRIGEENITPNMTGVQLLTVLQDSLEDKMVMANVNVYANSRAPQVDATYTGPWYKLIPTATATSLPLYRATASSIKLPDDANGNVGSYYNITKPYADSLTKPYEMLEAYLDGRGSSPAFGPAVKIELYEYNYGGVHYVDIIIISQYLVELTDKREDDSRTILVDESSLRFNVYDNDTVTVISQPPNHDECDFKGTKCEQDIRLCTHIRDIPELSLGWDTIYDDWAVGSSFIGTPYGTLTLNGFEPIGKINKAYEPARVISGVAGNSTATWMYLGDTLYDTAMISPTIRKDDRTNNYEFFLNEDDVIIGAKYSAPGRTSISGYLYLATATGLRANPSDPGSSYYAKATVIFGGGPGVWREVDLTTRANGGGQVWHPIPDPSLDTNWIDLPTGPAAFANMSTPASLGDYPIEPGWYSYTRRSDNTIMLGNVEKDVDGYKVDWGTGVTIARGVSRVSINNTGIRATNRTILARITASSTTSVANFNNFPTIQQSASTTIASTFNHRLTGAQALYKLEPGSGSNIAEIFYINLPIAESAEKLFGFLVQPGTSGFGIFDLARSEDYIKEPVSVTRMSPLNTAVSRFYLLEDEGEGVYNPTRISKSTSDDFYLRVCNITGGNFTEFWIEDEDGVVDAYGYHEERLAVLNIDDMRKDAHFEGYDDKILDFDSGEIVVLVIDKAKGAPIAAFVFNELVDRTAIPELRV